MINFAKTGSKLFGTAITGLGLVHFFYPGFRPVFLPFPAGQEFTFVPLLFGLSLVVAGLCIIFFKRYKALAAVFLGIELGLFFLFGHLPNRLKYHPEILGVWTDAIKLFALIGGSFLVAHRSAGENRAGVGRTFRKITPVGLYLFTIMLILFGLDHFMYHDLVSSLIPQWIPLKGFWTYFTGAALLGAGVLIALNLCRRQAALGLALMLLMWLILLHLPAFFSAPDKDAVNIVSSLECLAFCGTALLCARQNGKEEL